MNETRNMAIYGLGTVAGAVAGWKLWSRHPIIGAIIGWGVGANVASLLTGYDPWSAIFAKTGTARA